MPLFLWFALRERVTVVQWVGTILAFVGMMVLIQPWSISASGSLLGEGFCFIAMVLSAAYLTLGRLNRRMTSFWLYLVPVYVWAGVVSLVAAFFLYPEITMPSPMDWLWLVLLALVPTVFGHGLINFSLRHLSGQTVGVANQGQFIFAMPMAALFFHEFPAWVFYPSAALVLYGCWLATKQQKPPRNGDITET